MPKLTYCHLDIRFWEWEEDDHINLSKIFTSLQYLNIKTIALGHMNLDPLFEHIPYLRYLNVNAFDCTNTTPLYSIMTSMVRLKIYV